jgi:hypothetical protein
MRRPKTAPHRVVGEATFLVHRQTLLPNAQATLRKPAAAAPDHFAGIGYSFCFEIAGR